MAELLLTGLLTLAGVYLCFQGYARLRVTFFLVVFIQVISLLTLLEVPAGFMLVMGIAGGLLGGMVLLVAPGPGQLLTGVFAGFMVTHLIQVFFFETLNDISGVMVLFAALIGGLLALQFPRQVSIAGTAAGGAWLFILGILIFFSSKLSLYQLAETGAFRATLNSAILWGALIIWGLLALVGGYEQVGFIRRRRVVAGPSQET